MRFKTPIKRTPKATQYSPLIKAKIVTGIQIRAGPTKGRTPTIVARTPRNKAFGIPKR